MLSKLQRGRSAKPPRILCYGIEGVGKSTFASQAPKPVFIQCEDGLDEIDVDKFPLATKYDEVIAALADLQRESHEYETVVIDSLDWLERLVFDRLCAEHNATSIEQVAGGYSKGYTLALTYWREIIEHLSAADMQLSFFSFGSPGSVSTFLLRGCNVSRHSRGWAFRKSAFYKVIGYGPHNNGEDQELAGRLNNASVSEIDPCTFADPFYVYRYENSSYHLSYLDDRGYRELGEGTNPKSATTIPIGWSRDWDTMPVIRRFTFAPHVNPVDDKMRVELIGPVDHPGGNGPSNGMYALQKELRKRIDEGLDWLSIKSLPVSKGALPWFWNWNDRRYAMWWDAEGLPFVQGPNMLFTNSASPRIDREECTLLDAPNCRAMFCHSEWYHDLIAKHRGPENKSEIVMWPYPIDPWPGEPLPDEYDLLIYAKNGHRPQLLEHLAELFPRHIQIHYGRYRREELFEAARRSRACVYLADDDHGPLALQEILLAGCPTVGVRTGASFVRHGVSGFLVDRLPPGRQCVENDTDQIALAVYLDALARVQSLDRDAVRAAADQEFSTEAIVNSVIAGLEAIREKSAYPSPMSYRPRDSTRQ